MSVFFLMLFDDDDTGYIIDKLDMYKNNMNVYLVGLE